MIPEELLKDGLIGELGKTVNQFADVIKQYCNVNWLIGIANADNVDQKLRTSPYGVLFLSVVASSSFHSRSCCASADSEALGVLRGHLENLGFGNIAHLITYKVVSRGDVIISSF